MSDESSYFWYIRKGPGGDTVGIVGSDGDAVDADLTVLLRGEIVDDDRLFESESEFELPDEYVLPFVGGVLFELGVRDTIAYKVYNDKMALFKGKKVAHKYSGSRFMQKNLRSDKYTNVRSERDE